MAFINMLQTQFAYDLVDVSQMTFIMRFMFLLLKIYDQINDKS